MNVATNDECETNMQIIITRDNVYDVIVSMCATNASNAINVRDVANALQTTTKITRRHCRNLRDTNRIVYANRVMYAIVNDDANANDDDARNAIARRNNNDETRVRRDATRINANVSNVDTTRDVNNVTTRTRRTIDMFANALTRRNARRVVTTNNTPLYARNDVNDDDTTRDDDIDVYDMIDANDVEIVEIDAFDDDDAIDAFINAHA